MSLIRSIHMQLAAAALLAVLVPWWLIDSDDAVEAGGFPFPGRALALPEPPRVSEQAMGGRLFFAPVDSGAPDPAAPAATQVAAAPPPVPTLLGTATSHRGRAVAVLRLVSGETRLAARGESVDGWTVTAISEARVTLINQGVTQRLELPRSTAASTPSALPSVR